VAVEDSPKPAPEADAGKVVQALAPEKSAAVRGVTLEVVTEPGASVFLLPDGASPPSSASGSATPRRVLLGVADARGRLFSTPSAALCGASAVLAFEHPEHVALTLPLPRAAAGATMVKAPLALKPGLLAVLATPSSAEVFVDGVLCGNGIITLAVAPRVNHRVEIRLTGVEPSRHEVGVAPGATHFIRANLVPPAPKGGDILFLGTMRALASRADVTVLVDGLPARVVDGFVRAVPPGRHKVTMLGRTTAKGVRPEVLWERETVVNAGLAVSFGTGDAPGARVAPMRSAGPEAVSGTRLPPQAGESVRLYATLMDERGMGVSPAKARVTFDGVEPAVLKDGALLLPVNREGVLEVSVPGYSAESRTLSFPASGVRYISVVLRVAPRPAAGEWHSVIKAVSARDGVLILSSTPGRLLAAGQTVALVPRSPGAGLLRLSVLHASGGNVVCQVLPGQSGSELPGEGAGVTVRFLSSGSPALP
jgi:hypothetical protein